MRRPLLLFTALLFMLIGIGLLWHNSGCMVIGDQICTEYTQNLDLSGQALPPLETLAGLHDLQTLNLENTGLTADGYEFLRAALPQCRILWTIPFQGGFYPEDTQHLSLTKLTPADLRILSYFSQLQSIDAMCCSDLQVITQLRDAFPSCEIAYTVPLNGQRLPKDVKILTLGNDSVSALETALNLLPSVHSVDATQCRDYAGLLQLRQKYPGLTITYAVELGEKRVSSDTTALTLQNPTLAELKTALAYLPQLQSVELKGTLPTNLQLLPLYQKYPDVTLSWSFSLCGVPVCTTDTEIDLSGISIKDLSELEVALSCFPNLQTVFLCDCGIPSADMDRLSKLFPDTRFIWTVNIGGISLRTDAEYLAPFQHDVTLTDRDTEDLKYCVDLLCLDLGHNQIKDISFLANMPKLRYLILADTKVVDISPLAGLQELVFLELFLTKVTDYSPLLECPNLEDLNISYAIPNDMSDLCKLTQLKNLYLKGLWLDEWKQQLQEALPNTNLVFAGTGNISSTADGWRNLENYYRMRDLIGMPHMSY